MSFLDTFYDEELKYSYTVYFNTISSWNEFTANSHSERIQNIWCAHYSSPNKRLHMKMQPSTINEKHIPAQGMWRKLLKKKKKNTESI